MFVTFSAQKKTTSKITKVLLPWKIANDCKEYAWF